MTNEELKTEIEKLRAELVQLKNEYQYNRFSAIEVKTKKVQFNDTVYLNGRVIIKQVSSTPTTATVGELCVVGGILYICTAITPAVVWTKVGTQS